MAQYLSADKAVNVKTDTPMERLFTVSDNLHMPTPQGQYSTVYKIEVKGTQVNITKRSASAKDKMYLEIKINFFLNIYLLKKLN